MQRLGLALGGLLLGVNLAFGGQKSISANAAWVKAAAAGDATAAFVTIDNPTMYDAYLVAASSDIAAAITFRRGAGADAKAVGELTVPAYGALTMSPEGPHLWLTGLKRALTEKETVTLQLTTDGNQVLSVSAEVRK